MDEEEASSCAWCKSQNTYRRGDARLVALGFSKTFNKVWHRGLIHKLKSYGISDELLNLLSIFISEHQISVGHEGHSSSIRRINAGVPQGSVLGPSLFFTIYQWPAWLCLITVSHVRRWLNSVYCIPWSLVCYILFISQYCSQPWPRECH